MNCFQYINPRFLVGLANLAIGVVHDPALRVSEFSGFAG